MRKQEGGYMGSLNIAKAKAKSIPLSDLNGTVSCVSFPFVQVGSTRSCQTKRYLIGIDIKQKCELGWNQFISCLHSQ